MQCTPRKEETVSSDRCDGVCCYARQQRSTLRSISLDAHWSSLTGKERAPPDGSAQEAKCESKLRKSEVGNSKTTNHRSKRATHIEYRVGQSSWTRLFSSGEGLACPDNN